MEHNSNLLVIYILLFVSTQTTTSYLVQNWRNHKCLKDYLYMGFIPRYFNGRSMFPLNNGDVFICQSINGNEYFFTRYSKLDKIPIYSAYTINSLKILKNVKGTTWSYEKDLPISEQALNADYAKSGYDRGHLNPRSFNRYSGESVNATYTLTNAAPMLGSFNKAWYRRAERPLFTKMEKECNFVNARRYVITGVIPGESKMRQKVNIPKVIWTAACCDTTQVVPSTPPSWSIGYLMNATDNFYYTYTIQQLQHQLMLLHPNNTVVKLFQLSRNRHSGCYINDLKRKRKRT